jgi:hypothetical protein
MSIRSWIHICSRRGHPRRIASLLVGLVTGEHSPLQVAARTALPQLIWGICSRGASAILRAQGIMHRDTESPADSQNSTHPNNQSR